MTQVDGTVLQDRLRAVRIRFIEVLDERRSELEYLRFQLDQPEERDNTLKETQFIAHKIAGTASTLGYPELGQQAMDTENTIIQHLTKETFSPTFNDTKQVIDGLLMTASRIG